MNKGTVRQNRTNRVKVQGNGGEAQNRVNQKKKKYLNINEIERRELAILNDN